MTMSIQEILHIETRTDSHLTKKEQHFDVNLVLVLVILRLITNSKGEGALDRIAKKMQEAIHTTETLRGLQDNLITLEKTLGQLQLASQKEPTAQSWKEDKIGNIIKEFAAGYLDFQKSLKDLEKRTKQYPDLDTLLSTTEAFFKRFNTPLKPEERRTLSDAIIDWTKSDQDLDFHGTDIRFQANQEKDPTQFNRMIAWMMKETFTSHEGKEEAQDIIENWSVDDKACMQMLAGQSQQSSIEMKAYMTLISSYVNTAQECIKATQREMSTMTKDQTSQ